MAGLLVETDDFAAAAWALSAEAGDPLGDALFALLVGLSGCGGMAGSDPSGRAWASSYDQSAESALLGLRSLVNGCYRLSAMFARTCRNYAEAEAASVPGAGVPADIAELPGDCSVSWHVSVPPAAGAPASGPPGWSLIVGLVGRVWPGGHQDRLRAAAVAWRRAAGAVDDAGARVCQVPQLLAIDRLPEQDDIESVCRAVTDATARLATAMDQAASACDRLTAELDRVHSEVAHELASLAEQSAAIEGVGALLSTVSFGAAEVPTQAVEGSRLAAVAARVAELIDAFASAAREIVAGLPSVRDLAQTVGRGLDELFSAPLTVAGVTPVRTLAPELETVDGITQTEMTAERGLASEAHVSETLDLTRAEAEGGHTIAAHVGRSVEQLKARDIPFASTFTDLRSATAATEANLRFNSAKVRDWIESGRRKLTIYAPANTRIGVVYSREEGALLTPSRVRTVLVRDMTTGRWFVRTSFPDIAAGPR